MLWTHPCSPTKYTGSSSASTPTGSVVMHGHAKNTITISKYLPVCLYEGGPLRVLRLSPVTGEGPSVMSQPCSNTLTTRSFLPGSLLQQSLLTEEHFKKKFISLRSIKVRTEDSCFELYCLKNLALILLHESVADWAPLSSKGSSSTVGNRPAFTGAGSHPPPPPPSQHSFQSR